MTGREQQQQTEALVTRTVAILDAIAIADGWPAGSAARLLEDLAARLSGLQDTLAEPPIVVTEALRLADRIKDKYPDWMEREEAQNALVHLAEFVAALAGEARDGE